MEILILLSTILIIFVVVVFGIILKVEIKEKKKELYLDDIVSFINDNNSQFYIRDINCKKVNYHAHVVAKNNKNVIVIDIN
jgi:hypothetical protein